MLAQNETSSPQSPPPMVPPSSPTYHPTDSIPSFESEIMHAILDDQMNLTVQAQDLVADNSFQHLLNKGTLKDNLFLDERFLPASSSNNFEIPAVFVCRLVGEK